MQGVKTHTETGGTVIDNKDMSLSMLSLEKRMNAIVNQLLLHLRDNKKQTVENGWIYAEKDFYFN